MLLSSAWPARPAWTRCRSCNDRHCQKRNEHKGSFLFCNLEVEMLKLTALTSNEVESVHQATLRILNEIGIVLAQTEAREVLAGAGAKVQGERVFLPPDLVERAVGQCPPQVKIRGRDGKTVTIGDGSLYWHNVGGARDVYEPRTGQRRTATLQDVRDSTRLLDALDSVTTITPFFTPQDVPGPLMSWPRR
ncbi:MAG: hypothetical protein B6I34_05020 [Anaerolineaceae bacterium 4572_32.1]|nr:MAG: hypothetical protein B6I34_05020 [Anaerolineaceae bacterium 4572_32.1]